MIRRSVVTRLSAPCAAALLAFGLVSACSGTNTGSGFDTSGNYNGGKKGGNGADASSGGDNGGDDIGDVTGDGGRGGGGDDGGSACASSATKAESKPLDMYIMLDQSGSMTETVAGGSDKWTAVTGALNGFVGQPNLGGISVGIQYFGLPPSGSSSCPTTCNTNADCGSSGPCLLGSCLGCLSGGGVDSCNAADYTKPDVEIAALPGVASQITASIARHKPTTSTPTSAALQGAVNHAKTWAQAHTNDAVVVVLATDGDPTECDTNLTNINAIAAAGASGTPKVLTFVIGVGSSLTALNGIAAAGGTQKAFIVDTNQNVNQQFLAALNAIRGAALGCQYKIPLPAGGNPDFTKVNVQYKPGNGQSSEIIPQVADKSKCPASGKAWYYDNPSAPTQIVLCDVTCGSVTADATGEVDVLTGCKTVVR